MRLQLPVAGHRIVFGKEEGTWCALRFPSAKGGEPFKFAFILHLPAGAFLSFFILLKHCRPRHKVIHELNLRPNFSSGPSSQPQFFLSHPPLLHPPLLPMAKNKSARNTQLPQQQSFRKHKSRVYHCPETKRCLTVYDHFCPWVQICAYVRTIKVYRLPLSDTAHRTRSFRDARNPNPLDESKSLGILPGQPER